MAYYNGEKVLFSPNIRLNPVGRPTEEGGEIFGDYENNKALGEHSIAGGTNTSAGCKGYVYYAINTVDRRIFLKEESTELSNTVEILTAAGEVPKNYEEFVTGYTVEDSFGDLLPLVDRRFYLRFLADGHYNNLILTGIGPGYITYDVEEDTAFNPTSTTSGYHYLVVTSQPTIGSVSILSASLSFGIKTNASGAGSIAGGTSSKASGNYSIAVGNRCFAGYGSEATGYASEAIGNNSHAEGGFTKALGKQGHAEGTLTKAIGANTHAEGLESVASGNTSHTEGYKTTASGESSHSEGSETKASGARSHAEGNGCKAIGENTHAEGSKTEAKGNQSHAEGSWTTASGNNSHAEGQNTTASGVGSHAEGKFTSASGDSSHAGGFHTKATGDYQTVVGMYNKEDTEALFIVGNGDSTTPSNAMKVMKNGDLKVKGNIVDGNGNELGVLPIVFTWYHSGNAPCAVNYIIPKGTKWGEMSTVCPEFWNSRGCYITPDGYIGWSLTTYICEYNSPNKRISPTDEVKQGVIYTSSGQQPNS